MKKNGYTVVRHPLLKHSLSVLRDKKTPHHIFKEELKRISQILFIEASETLRTKPVSLATPMGKAKGARLCENIILVGILRAASAMIEAVLPMVPQAKVGLIGIFRDEDTLKPVHYYTKLPRITGEDAVFLMDPMLATGGTLDFAASILRKKGARKICALSVVACPKGASVFASKHPDIPIFMGALDPVLNKKGYIVPGLGDCGDRLFGT